jgi:hypothetical protein
MKMIQNVVIGKPLCEPHLLFASDEADWRSNEEKQTLFTDERFLPRVLVSAGVAKSVSDVRRNRPALVRELREVDFIMVKWGKKFLWIAVGE